jgi:hypothetical protein
MLDADISIVNAFVANINARVNSIDGVRRPRKLAPPEGIWFAMSN